MSQEDPVYRQLYQLNNECLGRMLRPKLMELFPHLNPIEIKQRLNRDLSMDVWSEIFSYFETNELVRGRRISKSIYRTSTRKQSWKNKSFELGRLITEHTVFTKQDLYDRRFANHIIVNYLPFDDSFFSSFLETHMHQLDSLTLNTYAYIVFSKALCNTILSFSGYRKHIFLMFPNLLKIEIREPMDESDMQVLKTNATQLKVLILSDYILPSHLYSNILSLCPMQSVLSLSLEIKYNYLDHLSDGKDLLQTLNKYWSQLTRLRVYDCSSSDLFISTGDPSLVFPRIQELGIQINDQDLSFLSQTFPCLTRLHFNHYVGSFHRTLNEFGCGMEFFLKLQQKKSFGNQLRELGLWITKTSQLKDLILLLELYPHLQHLLLSFRGLSKPKLQAFKDRIPKEIQGKIYFIDTYHSCRFTERLEESMKGSDCLADKTQ